MEEDTAEQIRPSFFSLLASFGWFPLLVLVLVVLFVVGLVGTTAYLLGKKSQVPKMPVEQTAAPEQNGFSQPTPPSTRPGTATLPSPTPPRTATPTPDQASLQDTSKWVTYTNTKYGYRFKYPKPYTIESLNPPRLADISRADAVIVYDNRYQPDSILMIEVFTPQDLPRDFDLNHFPSRELSELNKGEQFVRQLRYAETVKDTAVGGKTAKAFDIPVCYAGSHVLQRSTVLEHNGLIYNLSVLYSITKPPTLYQELLSTFEWLPKD